jgi:SecD/SecF fusion protein
MNVDMKKSLITRFALIAVIMVAWGSSLFPLRDRPVMDVFHAMSAPQMAKYQQQLDQAKASKDEVKAAELKKYLDDYKKLHLQMAKLNDDYKKLHNNEEMAPQRLLVMAARGNGDFSDHIQLRDFFAKFAGRADFSNNEVIRHVRAASRGRLRKGLDLQGGVEFIVSFEKLPESNETEDRIRDQVRDIIERRVNEQGLADAAVLAIQGSPKISVTLPAVSEADKADIRGLILMPAKLEFYRVHEDNFQLVQTYKANPADFKIPPGYRQTTIDSEKDGIIVSEPIFLKEHTPDDEAAILSGKGIGAGAAKGAPMVEGAYAASDPVKGYVVHVKFTTRGAGSFGRLTTEMQPVGDKRFCLAIVLDGKVYSAPAINEPITGGNCEISGSFTREEAKMLGDAIASGNLPAKLKIDSEFGTTASLGADTVRQGFIATIISCLAVYSFLIYYYRLCGVISVIALAANLLLTLGTMALLGASITMPGVAGLVLGLGMSVDANVLIYERMREELNKGKSLGNALRYGYDRAFWPIFDSNLTTIITALVLYKYGSGAIRGFAVTLAFGVAASMFTALTMTRFIFDFLMYNGWLEKVSMEGWLSKRMNLHVMRIAFPCFMVSLFMAVSSIGIGLYRGNDIFSIDFAGGIKIGYDVNEAKFPGGKRPSSDEIQQVILDNKALFGEYDITGLKSPSIKKNVADGKISLDIILPNYAKKADGKAKPAPAAQLDPAVAKPVAKGKNEVNTPAAILDGILEKKYPGAFVQSSYNQIGDLVGKDFRWKALLSLFLAALATIAYLAFRFELPYGVAAVVACIHDVIIAGGIYLATGGQMSLTVLAALLTILGWSLNDTIVIFDRIREELNTYPDKPYVAIVEDSVNDMFGRTLLVTASTLLGTLVLVVFGGPSLWEFSVVMLYGIVIGSYSTIYIASYMVIHWHKKVRGHKDTIPVVVPVVKS